MITRNEYNKALDVVEAYHKQLFSDIWKTKPTNYGKIYWQKWDKLYEGCSVRLRNIILSNPDYYLDDMTQYQFYKFRAAGKKAWDQFVELRGH